MNALRIKQERAQKLGAVNFIHEFAINHTVGILNDIKRKFVNYAIIGRRAGLWSTSLELKSVTLIDEEEKLNFKEKKFDLIIHALSLHR